MKEVVVYSGLGTATSLPQRHIGKSRFLHNVANTGSHASLDRRFYYKANDKVSRPGVQGVVTLKVQHQL